MDTLTRNVVVKAGDGFDHWHQVTCRDFSLTECRPVADRQFRARISIHGFGALMVNDIWSSTGAGEHIRVTRSASDIRRDPRDYFMLWLAVGGDVLFAQDGRQVRLARSDLVLHDQSREFTLEFGAAARAVMISIPRPQLTSRLPDAHHLTARRIGCGTKLGAFAGSIVRQLNRFDGGAGDDTTRRLSSSALDIFATAIQRELMSDASGSHDGERLGRVKKYILANLQDAGLTIDMIAAANGMAPRTLNRLFASEGTTPIRWLWQQRLAAAYTALAEGHIRQVTDAALSFGFSDLSHFSRAFKAAFGHAPHSLKGRAPFGAQDAND